MLIRAFIVGIQFIIVGLYLPPPDDVALLYSNMHLVTSFDVSNVLLLGDCNLVQSPVLDRLHPYSRWTSCLS